MNTTSTPGVMIAATSYTRPMFESIVSKAVYSPTESGDSFRPNSGAHHGFPVVAHKGFGGEGLVRKAGHMTLLMLSTSLPPMRLKAQSVAYQSRKGAIAMTTVNTPTTSITSITGTPAVSTITRRTVGMDLCAPFGVYLDGIEIGKYATEIEAQRHYDRLTLKPVDIIQEEAERHQRAAKRAAATRAARRAAKAVAA